MADGGEKSESTEGEVQIIWNCDTVVPAQLWWEAAWGAALASTSIPQCAF